MDYFMQGSSIGFRIEVHECSGRLGSDIIRRYGQYAIQERFLLSVTPVEPIRGRSFLQRENVVRIELNGLLQISRGFFPASLTPLDESCQLEYPGSIGQRLARNFQFSQRSVVVEIPVVKILSTGKVGFCCVWTKPGCCLDSCFS
jgi:hypothetical protein